MPYKLVRDGDKYFVTSPHGHYLSHHPLSLEQATRQKTAVTLSELRKEHRLPERMPAHHIKEEHVVHHSEMKKHHDREAMAGATWVPTTRDQIHVHHVLPVSDVFAPLPPPAHFLRKELHYASHG